MKRKPNLSFIDIINLYDNSMFFISNIELQAICDNDFTYIINFYSSPQYKEWLFDNIIERS